MPAGCNNSRLSWHKLLPAGISMSSYLARAFSSGFMSRGLLPTPQGRPGRKNWLDHERFFEFISELDLRRCQSG